MCIMKSATVLTLAICLLSFSLAKAQAPRSPAAPSGTKPTESKTVKNVGVDEFDKLRADKKNVVLDVRTPAEFAARATFAKNFFEAGGIEAISNDGFANRDRMVAAFKASGAKLACLCSSDNVYAEEAVDAAKALKAAGAQVMLAGRPKQQDALKAAGVEAFVFTGCDALVALRAAHSRIAS